MLISFYIVCKQEHLPLFELGSEALQHALLSSRDAKQQSTMPASGVCLNSKQLIIKVGAAGENRPGACGLA